METFGLDIKDIEKLIKAETDKRDSINKENKFLQEVLIDDEKLKEFLQEYAYRNKPLNMNNIVRAYTYNNAIYESQILETYSRFGNDPRRPVLMRGSIAAMVARESPSWGGPTHTPNYLIKSIIERYLRKIKYTSNNKEKHERLFNILITKLQDKFGWAGQSKERIDERHFRPGEFWYHGKYTMIDEVEIDTEQPPSSWMNLLVSDELAALLNRPKEHDKKIEVWDTENPNFGLCKTRGRTYWQVSVKIENDRYLRYIIGYRSKMSAEEARVNATIFCKLAESEQKLLAKEQNKIEDITDLYVPPLVKESSRARKNRLVSEVVQELGLITER